MDEPPCPPAVGRMAAWSERRDLEERKQSNEWWVGG